MGERIKVITSPTLTVNSAGTGFDDPSNNMWPADSTTAGVITPIIDGEILKVVLDYTSSDTNAVLTITTRDSVADTVCETTNWSTDETVYPLKLATDYTGAALTVTANQYVRYVVKGSLLVDCSGGTDNDTVVVKIYYR